MRCGRENCVTPERRQQLLNWLHYRARINEQYGPEHPITDEHWHEMQHVFPRMFREIADALASDGHRLAAQPGAERVEPQA